MLADELKWMLSKGWTAQYRHPCVDSKTHRPAYESRLRNKVTHEENKDTNLDMWGGRRNAELGAW